MATAQKIPAPATLLMPKATAIWMIENTVLTFRQIASFTGLTEIEIEALANEDIGKGMVGRNPVENKELTQDELERGQADPNYVMRESRSDLPQVKIRAKGPRYTPVSKRGDKPDAIAYILKHNPEIKDAQICKLVGTTKPTINSVRDRTHPAAATLRPRHPVELMLCTYAEYEKAVNKGLKAAGKDPEKVKAERAARLAAEQAPLEEKPASTGFDFSNFLKKSSTDQGDQ
ncbi:MAG: cell cycle transcriptional regulator TrcR [Alphaproteobacteria bacterium]